MKNGNENSAHHPAMTAATVPSYVIDASPTGVHPADFEELVAKARKRWIAVNAWRGMSPVENRSKPEGGTVAG